MESQNSTKLAVVVFSDIVDFTKLSSESQSEAVALVKQHEKDVSDLIPKHNGQLLKNLGDGLLLKFDSSRNSVLFAIELQKMKKSYELRISIHQGDMFVEGNDIFGDGVNIASRLNQFSPKGGIVLSKNVYDDINSEKDISACSIGDYYIKGKRDLFSLYTISNSGINVNQKIIRKNPWAKSNKTILRDSNGRVRYRVTSMPSLLFFSCYAFFKLISGFIHYHIYYFLFGFLFTWLSYDISIINFFKEYFSISFNSIGPLFGFIGFIRGITLGGCAIDFHTMDVKLKINRSTFITINEAEYSIMILIWANSYKR